MSSHGHGHGHDHGHDHGHGFPGRLRAALRPHAHDANEAIQSAEEASQDGIRAGWVGLAGMTATAVLQIVIVAVSGSIALLADTLHNVGHAVTTIPLLLAFQLGRRPPTTRFTYGYRRAEDLAGLFIGVVIAASAALIIWESARALVRSHPLEHLGWVFVAGVVGALGNELVAVYRIRTGKRIGSAALIAEGHHARADGLTSVAVVLGVVGVWAGFARADAVVGLLIAVVILWILVQSMRVVVRRLMDGVEPETVAHIRTVARSVDGVTGLGRVRARWIGHRLESDVEITVDGSMTVAEGHHVAERAHHELLHAVRHLEHVTVHVHPLVQGRDLEQLHQLSGHHASPAARARYLADTAAVPE